jgi:tripartite-type tricarboxylate transporter receptor subunit TctC
MRAARAAPEGYRLLVNGMSTMSFSPTLYPNLPMSTANGLDPVGIVASAPLVLVVGKQVPGNTGRSSRRMSAATPRKRRTATLGWGQAHISPARC